MPQLPKRKQLPYGGAILYSLSIYLCSLKMSFAWASVALLLWVGVVAGKDNLRVAYEWREMDFKYATQEQRWNEIERGNFKPAQVIPFGLEVAGHRLFVTLPRWRDGVPATLAYLDLNGEYSRVAISRCSGQCRERRVVGSQLQLHLNIIAV